MQASKFHSETKTVPFGNGTIRVENLTPILSPKDREKRKREVKTRLFDVFSKYDDINARNKWRKEPREK